MREAVFITEVVNSLKTHGCKFTYKPPDSPVSQTQSITKFTLTKPCDIITCDKKGMILIECKQIKKWEAFAKSDMRPSQIKSLTEAYEMNQRAWVFLNVRVDAFNTLLAFKWDKLALRFARAGSIKANELKDMAHSESAIHAKDGIFDLSSFLDL